MVSDYTFLCASTQVVIADVQPRVCPTCPYKWIITKQVDIDFVTSTPIHLDRSQQYRTVCRIADTSKSQISMRTHLKRKEVDDVLGGKDSWQNVDKTEGPSYRPINPSRSYIHI